MTPFRFRGGRGALFGVLHEPEAGRPNRRAMLMCAPFGQEAIRSQRLFRVIAERLARAGCATLRFDHFGTGDSDGDERDASLAAWIADVPEADMELRRRTGATSD
jgi:alpha/beta superfamily hydrolase